MTFFGLFGLLFLIYIKPHDIVPALAVVQPLYLFLSIIVLGILMDLNARRSRLIAPPQARLVLLFWFWCIFTLALNRRDVLIEKGTSISIAVTLYFVVAYGIQSVPRFSKLTFVIFSLGLFVAFASVYQGLQPFTCIEIIPGSNKGNATSLLCPMVGSEGQMLDGQGKCQEEGLPGLAYRCEKPGFFQTMSVMGRVRYLGFLEDPNEVSLATSMAVPFAFAFLEQKRSLTRLLLLLATLGLVGTGVVFSQSRGGQIVFIAVLGAYFMKKYGYKLGVIIAGVMALPLAMLGGRGGEEAEQSSLERLEAAAEGIKMLLHSRLLGVGYSQFTEHHYLTAHNAYILSAGELGLPGMCMFITLMMTAIKIPVAVLRHPAYDAEGAKAKSLAMALLATFGGTTVGIFLLSWTYHYVLWIHFGLTGALYSTVKARDPSFDVRITRRDVALALALGMVMIVGLTIHTKRKGVW